MPPFKAPTTLCRMHTAYLADVKDAAEYKARVAALADEVDRTIRDVMVKEGFPMMPATMLDQAGNMTVVLFTNATQRFHSGTDLALPPPGAVILEPPPR